MILNKFHRLNLTANLFCWDLSLLLLLLFVCLFLFLLLFGLVWLVGFCYICYRWISSSYDMRLFSLRVYSVMFVMMCVSLFDLQISLVFLRVYVF